MNSWDFGSGDLSGMMTKKEKKTESVPVGVQRTGTQNQIVPKGDPEDVEDDDDFGLGDSEF